MEQVEVVWNLMLQLSSGVWFEKNYTGNFQTLLLVVVVLLQFTIIQKKLSSEHEVELAIFSSSREKEILPIYGAPFFPNGN